jgi:phage N-6-adenine-methyltransferase
MKKDAHTPAHDAPADSRADVNRLGYIGRTPTHKPRDADAWFTPPEYIDCVRRVMGGIDLDPFSSDTANEIVGATHILTIEKSAFDIPWAFGRGVRVFMNPPYSQGLCRRAVERFIEQYEEKRFVEAIVLVNNATDTRWFKALVEHCDAVCFTSHRIGFWNADRKRMSANTRGQAFFYFGRQRATFRSVFEKHGFVLQPAR